MVELTVRLFIVLVDPNKVETFKVENWPLSERIEEVVMVEFTISSFIVLVEPNKVETFNVENWPFSERMEEVVMVEFTVNVDLTTISFDVSKPPVSVL